MSSDENKEGPEHTVIGRANGNLNPAKSCDGKIYSSAQGFEKVPESRQNQMLMTYAASSESDSHNSSGDTNSIMDGIATTSDTMASAVTAAGDISTTDAPIRERRSSSASSSILSVTSSCSGASISSTSFEKLSLPTRSLEDSKIQQLDNRAIKLSEAGEEAGSVPSLTGSQSICSTASSPSSSSVASTASLRSSCSRPAPLPTRSTVTLQARRCSATATFASPESLEALGVHRDNVAASKSRAARCSEKTTSNSLLRLKRAGRGGIATGSAAPVETLLGSSCDEASSDDNNQVVQKPTRKLEAKAPVQQRCGSNGSFVLEYSSRSDRSTPIAPLASQAREDCNSLENGDAAATNSSGIPWIAKARSAAFLAGKRLVRLPSHENAPSRDAHQSRFPSRCIFDDGCSESRRSGSLKSNASSSRASCIESSPRLSGDLQAGATNTNAGFQLPQWLHQRFTTEYRLNGRGSTAHVSSKAAQSRTKTAGASTDSPVGCGSTTASTYNKLGTVTSSTASWSSDAPLTATATGLSQSGSSSDTVPPYGASLLSIAAPSPSSRTSPRELDTATLRISMAGASARSSPTSVEPCRNSSLDGTTSRRRGSGSSSAHSVSLSTSAPPYPSGGCSSSSYSEVGSSVGASGGAAFYHSGTQRDNSRSTVSWLPTPNATATLDRCRVGASCGTRQQLLLPQGTAAVPTAGSSVHATFAASGGGNAVPLTVAQPLPSTPPLKIFESRNDQLGRVLRVTQFEVPNEAGVVCTQTRIEVLAIPSNTAVDCAPSTLFLVRHSDSNLWGRQMKVHKNVLLAARLAGVDVPRQLEIPIDSKKMFEQTDNLHHMHAYVERIVPHVRLYHLEPSAQLYWWRCIGNGAAVLHSRSTGRMLLLKNNDSRATIPAAVELLSKMIDPSRLRRSSFWEQDPDYPVSAKLREQLGDATATALVQPEEVLDLVTREWGPSDHISALNTALVIKMPTNRYLRYSVGVDIGRPQVLFAQVHYNEPLSRRRNAYPLCMVSIESPSLRLEDLRLTYLQTAWFVRKLFDFHRDDVSSVSSGVSAGAAGVVGAAPCPRASGGPNLSRVSSAGTRSRGPAVTPAKGFAAPTGGGGTGHHASTPMSPSMSGVTATTSSSINSARGGCSSTNSHNGSPNGSTASAGLLPGAQGGPAQHLSDNVSTTSTEWCSLSASPPQQQSGGGGPPSSFRASARRGATGPAAPSVARWTTSRSSSRHPAQLPGVTRTAAGSQHRGVAAESYRGTPFRARPAGAHDAVQKPTRRAAEYSRVSGKQSFGSAGMPECDSTSLPAHGVSLSGPPLSQTGSLYSLPLQELLQNHSRRSRSSLSVSDAASLSLGRKNDVGEAASANNLEFDPDECSGTDNDDGINAEDEGAAPRSGGAAAPLDTNVLLTRTTPSPRRKGVRRYTTASMARAALCADDVEERRKNCKTNASKLSGRQSSEHSDSAQSADESSHHASDIGTPMQVPRPRKSIRCKTLASLPSGGDLH